MELDQKYYQKVGLRIKSLRRQRGLTQETVAKKSIFLTKNIVGNMERGKGCTLENLILVGSALNINPAWLAGWLDAEHAQSFAYWRNNK